MLKFSIWRLRGFRSRQFPDARWRTSLLILTLLFMFPAWSASATTLVVGFDSDAVGLREASGAANEVRSRLVGLAKANVELSARGAVFRVDAAQRKALLDHFGQTPSQDDRLVATPQVDLSVLVSYRLGVLRRSRPDIRKAIPFLKVIISAAGGTDPEFSIREDGRVVIGLAGSLDIPAFEAALLGSIGLEIRPVDCELRSSEPTEAACDPKGRRFVHPYGGILWIQDTAIVSSDMIAATRVTTQWDGAQYIEVRLTPEGQRRFSHYTRSSVGGQMAFVFEGRVVMSAHIPVPLDVSSLLLRPALDGDQDIDGLARELSEYSPPFPLKVLEVLP
ncbi:MAG: hypothetical protein Q8L23_03805 [Caulobacter sp.]|nr:hypothetical protein [Caulobacter sp.]